LEHDAAPRVRAGDRSAVHEGATGGRGLEAGHDVEQRALAAARRTDQADERVLGEVGRDRLERLDRVGTCAEALRDVVEPRLRARAFARGAHGGFARFRHAIWLTKLLSTRPLRSFGIVVICPVSFRKSAWTWSVRTTGASF